MGAAPDTEVVWYESRPDEHERNQNINETEAGKLGTTSGSLRWVGERGEGQIRGAGSLNLDWGATGYTRWERGEAGEDPNGGTVLTTETSHPCGSTTDSDGPL